MLGLSFWNCGEQTLDAPSSFHFWEGKSNCHLAGHFLTLILHIHIPCLWAPGGVLTVVDFGFWPLEFEVLVSCMTWGELFSPKISFLRLESWQSLILRADVGVEWENSCKAFRSEHITCGVFGQCFLGNTATELLSMLGLLSPYPRPLAIRKQFVSGLGVKTVTPTLWQEIQSKQYDLFPQTQVSPLRSLW